MCKCEFANVGHHENDCSLEIPLLKKLETSRHRVIELQEFEAAAAIRDAIYAIRKYRGHHIETDKMRPPQISIDDVLEP